MDRRLPDIANSLEWNLVLRNEYQATENGDGSYTPISPISTVISDSHTLMIGVKSTMASPSWYTGGWAAQRLLLIPSSLTEFAANVQTNNIRLRLGVLNLCTFPSYQESWMLYLKIPRWIKQATVEIWRYDGAEVEHDTSDQVQTFVVTASTSSQVLLPDRPKRKGAIITNNSISDLFLTLDAVSSSSNYTARLAPGGYYETPFNYTGAIAGIWATAEGSATVKEFS